MTSTSNGKAMKLHPLKGLICSPLSDQKPLPPAENRLTPLLVTDPTPTYVMAQPTPNNQTLFVRLFVCVDGFKSRVITSTKNGWDANVFFRVCISWHTPCWTWDSAVHGLTHRRDLEHLLVGRWAWEMIIGAGPCPCSLDTCHGFLSSPRVFGH